MQRRIVHCMGTVFSIDVRAGGVADEALAAVERMLHRTDAIFSTYRADSLISRLARGELTAEQAASAEPDVGVVLADSARWQQRTDGWFSISAGGTLDPSGYVKGWAIARASTMLCQAGSIRHCVNGGGDLQCVGDAEPGRPWRAGIADPLAAQRLIATVAGTDLAVATSGTAERGRHILDPHTRRPAETALASLTVVGTDVISCDVLATAGFAMGERSRDFFATRAEVSAFAVRADGSTWHTFKDKPGESTLLTETV